jgi:phosphoenolpyruvate-protein kinase (PTS system EI component)
MATLSGTAVQQSIIESFGGSVTPLCISRVQFNVSGTYVQADNAQLTGVNTIIQNSRRDGKTVTLVDAMCGHPARKQSDPTLMMGLKTVAVSTNDVTFEITESATANTPDMSTELAAGAVPAQQTPFEILVSYTVA